MRKVIIAIVILLAAFSVDAAPANAQLSKVELRWLCAPHAAGCEAIEAIGDSAPKWVEKSPFFVTKSTSSWAECQRFGEPLLCITLAREDIEGLNSFAIPERRHSTAVVIYGGKAIAVMGFIGPANGPLYLGGPGGAMSTPDVKAFLESSK